MAKFLRVSEHSVYQGLSDSVTMLISGIDSERTLVKNVSRTSPFNIGDMDSIVGQGKSHKLHASSLRLESSVCVCSRCDRQLNLNRLNC